MRSRQGMSSVEMLVTLALVSLVLVIAGALLVRMARTAEEQARRPPAVGGEADRALDAMEHDCRRALVLARVLGEDGASRLILDMADGERVTWTFADASLRRRRDVLSGDPVERVVAGDVALVDWVRRSGHLLDLRLRRKDETLRQRTVLLRNLDRAAAP